MQASCSKWLTAVSLLMMSGTTLAQGVVDSYPAKPVTIIVAQTPGGPNDQEARLYLGRMQANLGQPFLLDFKPGAGSVIGSQYVARSAPDGYTLLLVAGAFTMLPALSTQPSYDAVKDFAPLSLMSQKPAVVVVNPAFAPKTFGEYIAYARNNPGKLNIGTAGPGSVSHLLGAWMHSATSTTVTYIPYKGVAPMLPDLFTGRVDSGIVTVLVAMPLVKAGKVRVLAITDDKRSRLLPDVPTIAESGLPGFSYSNWLGFVAPAATPAGIVNRLADSFAKAAKSPDVIAALEADGSTLVGSTPAQFRQLIATEAVRWKKLVVDNGIQGEN